MEDTDRGVKYSRCVDYGDAPHYGVKAEKHFYMSTSDNGYSLQADGSLVQTTYISYDYRPGFNYTSIATLRKESNDVSIDNGTFVINGPITNAEYNHVCLWHAYANIGDRTTTEILVPFDDDSLSLRLELQGEIFPGTYAYAQRYDESQVRLDVMSNSTLYWNLAGSNTLSPTT